MSHHKQSVSGLLLLDKPEQLTSNDALQRAKKLVGAKKAGHTGSLDPLATGMLPICLGEATKFSQYLLEADKAYEVTMQLGVATTTGDAEGETIEQSPVQTVTSEELDGVLKQFTGEIQQIPSMYSAIKHQGKPLYEWAREGVEIERQPREVMIYSLTVLDLAQQHIRLKVRCGKGTYIRTLVEDIAKETGNCAHATELRRISVAGFDPQDMVTMDQLVQTRDREGKDALRQYLMSVETIVDNWPEAKISRAAAYYIRQGQPVIIPYAPPRGWVKLVRKEGGFLGVGEILDDGRVAPRRLVSSG